MPLRHRLLIRQSRSRRVCLCSLLVFTATFFFCNAFSFAQEVIFRDLTKIRGVPVANIDDELLYLTDGQRITWDQVLQARVDPVWQQPLNKRVEKFGMPLYRLKHRLRQSNINGAFEIAKDWYGNEAQAFSGDEANFLVCRAVMMGRIRRGDRAAAVEPMIQAIGLQEKCSASFLNSFRDLAFSQSELETSICDELIPVWRSVEETESVLESLDANFDLTSLVEKWPGLAVYLSSMAVYINQRERMTEWNPAMGGVAQLRPWQRLLGSDLSRTPLSRLIDGSEGAIRVTTMYWWATEKNQLTPKRQRMLTLLKIVANYSEQFPELVDDALSQAVKLTDDVEEQSVIRKAFR